MHTRGQCPACTVKENFRHDQDLTCARSARSCDDLAPKRSNLRHHIVCNRAYARKDRYNEEKVLRCQQLNAALTCAILTTSRWRKFILMLGKQISECDWVWIDDWISCAKLRQNQGQTCDIEMARVWRKF